MLVSKIDPNLVKYGCVCTQALILIVKEVAKTELEDISTFP